MAMHAGSIGGATSVAPTAFPLTPTAGTSIVSTNSVVLVDDGIGVLALKNGTTPQIFRVYATTTGPKYVELKHDGTDTYLNGFSGNIYFSLAGSLVWGMTSSALSPVSTNNSYDLGGSGNQLRNGYFGTDVYLAGPMITAGSGTGLTVNYSGVVRRQTHKVTVTFAALAAAATTADKTIATLPAKTRLVGFYAETTTKYIGGAVSAATLKVGAAVNGGEILASHDVFTAAVNKGLADADMGTAMTRAAQIQGGYMPSFSGTTIVSVRLTTTTANTNALTQGSTTYYLETEVLP